MDHSETSPLRITVLCGNPRPASRTLSAAVQVSNALAAALGGDVVRRETVDLADLAPELFAPARPRVEQALSLVTHSDVLVVATPVYKGTYSGLLKSFLDGLPHRALAGAVAIPVTVMGHPAHALAADVHLRPLLVELGASTPTAAVVLTEDQLTEDDPTAQWAEHNARLAVGSARSLHELRTQESRTRREEALA
ncbi:MAG: NADPH-dependent FMN reductase [Nocardioidaceae bacterium]